MTSRYHLAADHIVKYWVQWSSTWPSIDEMPRLDPCSLPNHSLLRQSIVMYHAFAALAPGNAVIRAEGAEDKALEQ